MNKVRLCACTFIIEDDLMWFVPMRYNYLCCYNLVTEKVEKKFRLPEGNYYPRMYDNLLSYKGKLYLIPYGAKNIVVFDRLSANMSKISLELYMEQNVYYYDAVIREDYLYIFAERTAQETISAKVIKINLSKKDEIEVIESDNSDGLMCSAREEMFNRNSKISYEKFASIICGTNRIIEYNFTSDEWKVTEVGNSENKFITMHSTEQFHYCICENGKLIVCNKLDGGIVEYKTELSPAVLEMMSYRMSYRYSFEYKHKIWFVFNRMNRIIEVDKNTHKIVEHILWQEQVHELQNPIVLGEKLYMWDIFTGKFLTYDFENKESQELFVVTNFEEDELESLYRDFLVMHKDGYKETDVNYLNVEYLIKQIASKENRGDISGSKKKIGDEIYQICLKTS